MSVDVLAETLSQPVVLILRIFAVARTATPGSNRPQSALARRLGALALAAALLATLTPAETRAQVSIACPAQQPSTGTPFTSEITINVGTRVLGAYTLNITYQPAVVTIQSIAGGTTAEFSGLPTTNSGTFTSGLTPIS